jgi:hypothetical protein
MKSVGFRRRGRRTPRAVTVKSVVHSRGVRRYSPAENLESKDDDERVNGDSFGERHTKKHRHEQLAL